MLVWQISDRTLLAGAAQDFLKDDIKHYKKAVKFYDDLGMRLTAAGHCLDVYACSLDQVGLAEMHPAVAASGKVPPSACMPPLAPTHALHARTCTLHACTRTAHT